MQKNKKVSKLALPLLCLLSTAASYAQDSDTKALSTKDNQTMPADVAKSSNDILDMSKEVFGADPAKKFSFYLPSYFAVGKDDLKLQFSGKYRVANSYNLYLAYTQLMFWHIYEDSMPFEEINYSPEIFYRLVENRTKFLRSIDIGALHTSNGEDGEISRSINSAFIKGNTIVEFGKINFISELKFFYTFNKDKYSKRITDYIGYWEYKGIITHVITHNKAHLDIEFKLNAGKKAYNLDMGARELGLIYNFGSPSFNPNIYLQYFSGYGENLLHQNKKQDVIRLGLMLSI